jgi:spermidine/putrescine transport system substrate-binding protein
MNGCPGKAKKHLERTFVLCLSTSLILLSSCTEKSSTKNSEINLFIWSAYISQDVLNQFEQQTGIHVNYDTYDSNQVLLEKLRSGVTEYDVIAPTNWLIHSLVQLKLIQQLDSTRLPNRINLMRRF